MDGSPTADASNADASQLDAGNFDAAPIDSPPAGFVLTSTAFVDGALIPAKHTCTGVDVSPLLAWSGAPAGTLSFAFTMKDVTFGSPFNHSAAWEIPLATASLMS